MHTQRNAASIRSALPILIRAIGRKMDVDVRIGGKDACTDGSTVVLPSLPFEDPEVEVFAFGFAEHESAHLKYTDFDLLMQSQLSPVEQKLANAFEDVRVEKRLFCEYPGFAPRIAKLVERLVADGEIRCVEASESPSSILHGYVGVRLRGEVLGQAAAAQVAANAETVFRATFPAAASVRIGAAIGQVDQLQSTTEAIALARTVVRILEEESEKPPESSSDPSTGDGSGSEAPAAADGEESQRAALREVLADGDGQYRGLGEMTAQRLCEHASVRSAERFGGLGFASESLVCPNIDAGAVLSQVAAATTALRTRMRGLILASRRERRTYSRHGARTEPRRLLHYMLGDPRIFKQRVDRDSPNTAVALLIDRSSSMRDKIELALDAGLASAASLETIPGIRVWSGVFPGEKSPVESLKGFDERLSKVAQRHRGVRASGGTPMADAILCCAELLLAAPAPRKMLFVFTDGEPNNLPQTAELVRSCWRGGVEVYGMGIDVTGLEEIFPVSRELTSIEQLAPTMFSLLQDAMCKKVVA